MVASKKAAVKKPAKILDNDLAAMKKIDRALRGLAKLGVPKAEINAILLNALKKADKEDKKKA